MNVMYGGIVERVSEKGIITHRRNTDYVKKDALAHSL